MQARNEQEAFWVGEFGDQYTDRNYSEAILQNNIGFFSRILAKMPDIQSVIEFGANRGLNLQAIHHLCPTLQFTAVEINQKATADLKKNPWINVYEQSIIEHQANQTHDLVLVKGVLIHINPQDLTKVYDVIFKTTKRYILLAEYYNPSPVTISYRGHENKLFKRDFAGELLDRFSNLKLIDYGFCYHRDPLYPQDDLTWFLIRKDN